MACLHKLGILHPDLKGVSSTILTSFSFRSRLRQAGTLDDNTGATPVSDFGLMSMTDPSTIPFSETAVSFGGGGVNSLDEPGAVADSPSGFNSRPTHESDCYAFGVVVYEVYYLY